MTTSWGRAPEASYRTSCVQPNSATPGGGAGGGSEGRSPWSPASHSLKRMGWGGGIFQELTVQLRGREEITKQ